MAKKVWADWGRIRQSGFPPGFIRRSDALIFDMDQIRTYRRDGVSLVMDAGSVNFLSRSFFFQSHDGMKTVACGISRDALLDLGGYHRLNGAADEVFRALRPEIERITSAKYRAGHLDRDGAIVIGPADILLFGFERRSD